MNKWPSKQTQCSQETCHYCRMCNVQEYVYLTQYLQSIFFICIMNLSHNRNVVGCIFAWLENHTLLRFFDIKLRGSVLSLSGIPVFKKRDIMRNTPEFIWTTGFVCLSVLLTIISSATIHGSVRRGEKRCHTLSVFLQRTTSQSILFHRWTAFTSR